ncbi:MAG: M14 family metallopeptidase [Candidatus Competibacteraceae bacterium]|jgi:predicted deacylase|nr:M14 family metallopeptidase [Candidatus Competibacteraceae bacterium]
MEKQLETILAIELPYRETLKLQRSVYRGTGDGPRVAVVAGIHGDELEGLYVCHRLAAWLEELARTQPNALSGQVELYPSLNPLGLDTLQRAIPVYDSDLNCSFPGHPEGLLPQRIAAAVIEHLQEKALVLDIHASNVYLREMPQVRIDQRFADNLIPLTKHMNLSAIWVQDATTVRENTLAYTLNDNGVPCLMIEMGAGMGLTPAFTEQLLIGILAIWQNLGVLAPELKLTPPTHDPLIFNDSAIYRLNADTSGLFVPIVQQGGSVQLNELVGRIVSPFEGPTLAEVRSPVSGTLLTLREYPLVYEGSLLARVVSVAK